jgi:hypothetical protein
VPSSAATRLLPTTALPNHHPPSTVQVAQRAVAGRRRALQPSQLRPLAILTRSSASPQQLRQLQPSHNELPQLQTEGEALLGGRPEWTFTPPESPTKTRSRATGWMGHAARSDWCRRRQEPFHKSGEWRTQRDFKPQEVSSNWLSRRRW